MTPEEIQAVKVVLVALYDSLPREQQQQQTARSMVHAWTAGMPEVRHVAFGMLEGAA